MDLANQSGIQGLPWRMEHALGPCFAIDHWMSEVDRSDQRICVSTFSVALISFGHFKGRCRFGFSLSVLGHLSATPLAHRGVPKICLSLVRNQVGREVRRLSRNFRFVSRCWS